MDHGFDFLGLREKQDDSLKINKISQYSKNKEPENDLGFCEETVHSVLSFEVQIVTP